MKSLHDNLKYHQNDQTIAFTSVVGVIHFSSTISGLMIIATYSCASIIANEKH